MTKPTPRADLVKAVSEATSIVNEAIPLNDGMREALWRHASAMRAAALPVIVRELLDCEVE